MKIVLLAALMASNLFSIEISNHHQQIQELIEEFSLAGDRGDHVALEKITSSDYRIIMNQLFGSKKIEVMDRSTYLEMIKTGKFGGDSRTTEIKSILINGNNAIAEVNFWGKKMNVSSILNLAMTAEGKWVIVSDTPTILK